MKRIFSIMKGHKLLLIVINIFLIIIAIINRFPAGSIYANGDVFQYFEFSNVSSYLSYTWDSFNGQGSFLITYGSILFYLPLVLATKFIHISTSDQSLYYLAVLFIGSFWAFYWSSIIFFGKGFERNKIALFSLIYALNPYIIYNLIATSWAFQHFLFMYLIFPFIFVLTYKLFSTNDRKYLIYLLAPFFLLNIPNSNFAFFVSLNLIVILLIILLIIFYRIKYMTAFKNFVLYYLAMVLTTMWTVLPQIVEMFRMAKNLSGNESVFNLGDWIIWQSLSFKDAMAFFWGFDTFYTKLFPGLIFSFGIFFAFVLVIFSNLNRKSRFLFISLIMVLFLLFLENKGRGWVSESFTLAFFNNPLLGALRSIDKTIIFSPFIVIFSILVLSKAWARFRTNFLIAGLIFICVICAWPLMSGNLFNKYHRVSLSKNMDYQALVKIPQEYKDLADLVNKDKLDQKIFHLPYSVINSVGWVNYPKWGLVGIDPIIQLLNKPSIYMNNVGFYSNWNYGEQWNKEKEQDSIWLLPFIGEANARYLIFHKDIDQSNLYTQDKMHYYKERGFISLINSNDFFDLYKLDDRYFLPHFYIPKKIKIIDRVEQLSDSLFEEKEANVGYIESNDINRKTKLLIEKQKYSENQKIEYRKIDQTKYRVILRGVKGIIPLIFLDSYHSGWGIYLDDFKNSSLKSVDKYVSKSYYGTRQDDRLPSIRTFNSLFVKQSPTLDHLKFNGYSNGWFLDIEDICKEEGVCYLNKDGSKDVSLIVQFWPQRLYYIGLWVSSFTLIIGILLIFYYRKKYGRK